jgi:ABC-2 type transport system permease protein
MNKILLKLLDLLAPVFRLIQVDYPQMRSIVAVKLMTDNRRQTMYRAKESDQSNYTFLWTVFFYAIFGAFIALAVLGLKSFMAAMILFFSYIMVMVAMTLITDFSSILLDTSDNTIILPRPVTGRTLFTARIVHILLYLGMLTLGLCAFPILAVTYKYGAGTVFFFVLAILLSVVTAVVITNGIYLLVMKYSSEEKLKSIINYFQIGMAVFFMAGYQLMPRLIGRFDLDDYAYQIEWYSFLIPPVWMASALEMWEWKIFDTEHVSMGLFAVVVPLLSFYLVNKYLSPIFTEKVAAMSGTTNAVPQSPSAQSRSLKWKLAKWISKDGVERGAFTFIYSVLARDRKLKLKIYPTFGYMFVFGLVFLFRGHEDLSSIISNLSESEYYFVLIYIPFMVLQVTMQEIAYSDDFKASWIYLSAPLEQPGRILIGTLKAVLVRLFVPAYLIMTLIMLAVWGFKILPDIVFGFVNNIVMASTMMLVMKKYLPLSMSPNIRNQSGNFIRSMLMILLMGALGFSHYLLARFPMLVIGALPVMAIVLYYLMNLYSKTRWNEVTL